LAMLSCILSHHIPSLDSAEWARAESHTERKGFQSLPSCEEGSDVDDRLAKLTMIQILLLTLSSVSFLILRAKPDSWFHPRCLQVALS
jgi:hypothetical protein